MSTTLLTEVQGLNLAILHLIRTGLLSDPDVTRHMFQLSVEQADSIRNLTFGDVEALAASASALSLFVPRPNLAQLLAAPPGLVPVLASVRAGNRNNRASRTPGRRSSDYLSADRDAA